MLRSRPKPKTLFIPAPQTSLARSLYPSGSFALPGLAPYWPHATRRRAANTHTHTHSHTQAACNSVIDSPLVRRARAHFSLSVLPFLFCHAIYAFRFDCRRRLRHRRLSSDLGAGYSSRRDLGPLSLPMPAASQPISSAYLATDCGSAGLDTESALRLRLGGQTQH